MRDREMEAYQGMTDEELISVLKKYNIPHGPVVGTTRKLYEKKIYEVETQRIRHSPQSQSTTYSDSDSHVHESRRYDDLSREGRISGGSPAYQRDDSDSQFCERQQYDLPQKEEHGLGYQDKGGDGYYAESFSTTKTYGEVPVRQRLREEAALGSANNKRKYYSKENTYQDLSQHQHAAGSSLSVEPRRAIREKPKSEAVQAQTSRFFPLWLQFLLLILLVGFLVFVYFFVQPEDENPFQEIPN